MMAFQQSRPWGGGVLTIGLDFEAREVLASFKAGEREWGPAYLMELPEQYQVAHQFEYMVKGWFSCFDATYGGDRFFSEKFGDEPAAIAYGAWRTKAKNAREVLTRDDAIKVAVDLLEAFYFERDKPWKTPFDNWAMVNNLSARTFGKWSAEELIQILGEADEMLRDRHEPHA